MLFRPRNLRFAQPYFLIDLLVEFFSLCISTPALCSVLVCIMVLEMTDRNAEGWHSASMVRSCCLARANFSSVGSGAVFS